MPCPRQLEVYAARRNDRAKRLGLRRSDRPRRRPLDSLSSDSQIVLLAPDPRQSRVPAICSSQTNPALSVARNTQKHQLQTRLLNIEHAWLNSSMMTRNAARVIGQFEY